MTRALIPAALALALTGGDAHAFCGFYVAGADAGLYADATMVTLLRHGTTTVLSMQNTYAGPPEDFALVVPVPEVLSEENVKTLPKALFGKIDTLAAPRLVEYWEQDPCQPPIRYDRMMMRSVASGGGPKMEMVESEDLGVTVEAQFEVAEYEIVILSAKEAAGLETWLTQSGYKLPDGASAALTPYVASGTKFFAAKVDPEKVTFEGDRAVLSPLRVHYTDERFQLPVRLGLLNSRGQQDLIVHILAQGQRYDVANYPKATIPTNLIVKHEVREDFGSFYDAVFREAAGEGGGKVVTEYSWDASTCDPCPGPTLTGADLATLGADVIAPGREKPAQGMRGMPMTGGWVLTRLHHRYGADGLDEDLVFEAAPPLVGGRGMPDAEGDLKEQKGQPGPVNNFQGRYVMLNRWEGEIACESPQRGVWGGPPGELGQGPQPKPIAPGPSLRQQPKQLASLDVRTLLAAPAPAVGLEPKEAGTPEKPEAPTTIPEVGGDPAPAAPAAPGEAPAPQDEAPEEKEGCQTAPSGPLAGGLALLGLLGLRRRR